MQQAAWSSGRLVPWNPSGNQQDTAPQIPSHGKHSQLLRKTSSRESMAAAPGVTLSLRSWCTFNAKPASQPVCCKPFTRNEMWFWHPGSSGALLMWSFAIKDKSYQNSFTWRISNDQASLGLRPQGQTQSRSSLRRAVCIQQPQASRLAQS